MADYRIGCMSLAATNVGKMVEFYSGVFGVNFVAHPVGNSKVFEGSFAGIDFVLVPAELSGIKATESRIHFDVYVPDIQKIIDLTGKHGGSTNGRLVEDDQVRCIGISDPDGNFMVIKQQKKSGA